MSRWVFFPRLSASTRPLFTFCKKKADYSSEGQYLKEAHFFLKKSYIVVVKSYLFFNFHGVHNKLYVYL